MKSYLKFLSRNKLYTAIEATGLAVSLAFVILIGSYVVQQVAVTHENPDYKRIYVLGMPDYFGLTYGYKDIAIERIPEIETMARYNIGLSAYVTIEDKGFDMSRITAVDKEFFDIFPYYHFLEGSKEVLSSASSVVVSEMFAKTWNLHLGQNINVAGNDLTIGGIIEDFDGTLFRHSDIILCQESPVNEGAMERPFDQFGNTIPFVKLRPDADYASFCEKAEEICKEVYPSIYGRSFFEYLKVTRLDKVFFSEHTYSQFHQGDWESLQLLMIVGTLLLICAVFNYINLNTALSGKRAREMASRRLLGASQGEIFRKYILESIAFTAVCFVIALLLAIAFVPMMNQLLSDPDIPIHIEFSPGYVWASLSMILVVGTLAGWLPAMRAMRYKPINIVKGAFRASEKKVFSKVFIVLQSAFAVFLITMALVMECQYRFSLQRPIHANISDKYYLSFFVNIDQTSLRDKLEELPCVARVGKSNGAPGVIAGGQYSNTRDGDEILYRLFRMDSTAFSMLGIEKLKDFKTPLYNSVWFSDVSFNAAGFDDEYHDVSQTLAQRTSGCDQVGGTFVDFPCDNTNMGETAYPVISLQKTEDIRWGGWLIETIGDHKEAAAQIKETYEKWFMEKAGRLYTPLHSYYLEDHFLDGLKPVRNNMHLLEIFMALGVLISILGLLAMSTFYAGENAKGIAIRKVFGGTVESESYHSIRDYMILSGISCIIGIPVAVWAARKYLEQFIYKMDHYNWIFFLSTGIALSIAFGTVLWQVLKAARTNPATELKKE